MKLPYFRPKNLKILEARVENYKSLRKVKVDDLGNLVVFIGANNSGKSNLLEALNLFFAEFSATGGNTKGVTPHLWHRKATNHAISFELALSLTSEEFNQVVPTEFSDMFLEESKEEGTHCTVKVVRRLQDLGGSWRTDLLTVGKLTIAKDDKLEAGTELQGIAAASPALTVYFFTQGCSPKNIGGDILVVDEAKKLAYHTNAEINKRVQAGLINSSTKTWGQNYRVWAPSAGYRLIERPPTADELPRPGFQNVAQSLSELLRKSFKLVPSIRGSASLDITRRLPQIPTKSLDRIRKLWGSENADDEMLLSKFKRDLSTVFSGTLGYRPDYIDIDMGTTRLPIEYMGGGFQERFAIQEELMEDGVIYGLEEPEIHQHPRSARDLFDLLKRESAHKQIFLTTHSPLFIDPADLSSTWIVHINGIESNFTRPDELRSLLDEVGASPTDSFFPDKILLVEGNSDKIFVSGLAQKMGVDLTNLRIVPIHGKDKSWYNFEAWNNIVLGSQIRLVLLLDRDARLEALRLVTRGIAKSKDVILLPGDLEDLYPILLLVEVLNKTYDLEIRREDLETGRRVEVISKSLRDKKKDVEKWKEKLAAKMVEKIPKEDIPKDVRQVIERLTALE
jgi:predicted ATPase